MWTLGCLKEYVDFRLSSGICGHQGVFLNMWKLASAVFRNMSSSQISKCQLWRQKLQNLLSSIFNELAPRPIQSISLCVVCFPPPPVTLQRRGFETFSQRGYSFCSNQKEEKIIMVFGQKCVISYHTSCSRITKGLVPPSL